MIAIIPVAGIGSRLRPHTHTQPKSLIPLAGKPILGHIIDNMVSAGFKKFIFVIGYLGDKIEDFVKSKYETLETSFVIQTTGKGIGHAIWLTKELIPQNEEIFIVLGDTIFETNLGKVIISPYSSLGVKKVNDPRLFGVAEVDDKGFISKVIEKPSMPKSNLALVGLYKIRETALLFECIEHNIANNIKTKNEFHLTDALMAMIEKGVQFTTFNVENWFDCGKKEILLQTNSLLLKRGNFMSPDRSLLQNNIIIPPVYISEKAKVSNSIIGPNVSVGDDALIESSIINHSIIGPNAHLEHAVLTNSLIGNDASLHGTVQSLNLGDSAEINFS